MTFVSPISSGQLLLTFEDEFTIEVRFCLSEIYFEILGAVPYSRRFDVLCLVSRNPLD